MHVPKWMYARQYLWVRLAINVSGRSFSKKMVQNSYYTSLNKAQHKEKLLCG
jgi:hypothetical protein